MINLDRFNRILSVDTAHKKMRFEAGIRLHDLNLEAKKYGLTIPNLGSIDAQSVAGAIATATHGSSLRHGLLSDGVRALWIMLASGEVVRCSADENLELFRAALVSLGALGVVVEVEMVMAAHCNIEWEQSIQPLSYVFDHWDTTLWTQTEFVRVWWLPHTRRAIVWKADKTEKPLRPARKSWLGGKLGYYTYFFLLLLSHKIPSLLPFVEWFVFGLQYGFRTGESSINSAVQEQREGLLMDCLYSQFVNEWAIPLNKGPEAIRRLSAWLNGADEQVTGIPFDNKNLYVHAPIEVRVTNTSDRSSTSTTPNDNTNATSTSTSSTTSPLPPTGEKTTPPVRPRPFLDNTTDNTPTLYFNATLYRPWGLSPPSHERYYAAFEFVMRQLGGRPHWAKNFATVTSTDVRNMYGSRASLDTAETSTTTSTSTNTSTDTSGAATSDENERNKTENDLLSRWLAVRQRVDPHGMFVGDWLRRIVLGDRRHAVGRSGQDKVGDGADLDDGLDDGDVDGADDSCGEECDEKATMKKKKDGRVDFAAGLRGAGAVGYYRLPLEEVRVACRSAGDGGKEWFGRQACFAS